MSVAELKDSVLALAPEERHEFLTWVNRPPKSGIGMTAKPLPRIQRGGLWLFDLG
ncbi:MAG: hypothetical protein NT154_19135 [Verrucomicrobia bacterium]|nr:hypothetical protein [Verrucomicrobiota bacterium]